MKKKIIIGLVIVALCVGGYFGYSHFKTNAGGKKGSSDSEVYVMSVADIMGMNAVPSQNAYMGVVEGQETSGVNRSSERDLDTVFVKKGDEVSVGTPLFSYKTDKLEADIVQFGFDIEGANLQIADYNRQIENLTKEMNKEKDKDKKQDYANQIEGIRTSIAISENSIEQTQSKIDEAQKKIDNSVVSSSVNGVVTGVQDENNPNYSDAAFISILASTQVRVRGQVNEQNVASINVNQKVVLKSRVDETQTWTGTISKIDTESKASSNSGSEMGSGSGSGDNASTKYPFYVDIDDSEGLMMGQHLYIEIQEDNDMPDYSNGTYLYDYYICYDEDSNAYVWKMNDKAQLEKSIVELGAYDEENGVYKIESGITVNDQVAYPMDDYEEGMSCVTQEVM